MYIYSREIMETCGIFQEQNVFGIKFTHNRDIHLERPFVYIEDYKMSGLKHETWFSVAATPMVLSKYTKTCLKRNLKGWEHFSSEDRFPFNQGVLRESRDLKIFPFKTKFRLIKGPVKTRFTVLS
jgi:hypothetical protein